MPLSGEIIELNETLESNPEIVNNDPYGKGWMIKVVISNSAQIDSLLDSKSYQELVH